MVATKSVMANLKQAATESTLSWSSIFTAVLFNLSPHSSSTDDDTTLGVLTSDFFDNWVKLQGLSRNLELKNSKAHLYAESQRFGSVLNDKRVAKKSGRAPLPLYRFHKRVFKTRSRIRVSP